MALLSLHGKAELVAKHTFALNAIDTKEREVAQNGVSSLLRERDKRVRMLELQAAQHVSEIQKLERKLDREWKTIYSTLQKQLGLQQTNAAQLQLQLTRAQRQCKERDIKLESNLAKAHASFRLEQDEHKVHGSGLFCTEPLYL